MHSSGLEYSFITDATGYVDQHIQYLPFGELFISQRNSTFDSRYKFTAKELDNETNYSYFGARYYDSDISIWLSIDPLSDKYPSLSPYAYCANNPVILVDPDGRSFDGFTIDRSGKLERVDNTGGNKYDVIFNKEDYDAGKRDYDDTGDNSGMKINRGELSNFKALPVNEKDTWSDDIIKKTERHSIEVKTKNVADNLFRFLHNSTDVEWGNKNFTSPDGKNLNVFVTSYHDWIVAGGRSLIEHYMERGYTLNISDHGHPNKFDNGDRISGKYGEVSGFGEGDKGTKQVLQNYKNRDGNYLGKDAIFRVFWRNKYYPY